MKVRHLTANIRQVHPPEPLEGESAMRLRTMRGLALGLALTALVTLLAGLAPAQGSQGLRYGQTIDDAVTTRLGDTWTFQGCAGDVITVTMRSTEFDTFLELTGPLGPDPLVADD